MSKQSIDRRSFLRLFAGAAGLMSLDAFLAGCSSRSEESSSSGDSDSSQDSSSGGSSTSSSSSGSSSDSSDGQGEEMSAAANPSTIGGDTAIVYFSWSGTTRQMAERLSQVSGAPLWRIVPTNPYTRDYDECTDVARQEQNDNTYPTYVGDIDDWSSVKNVLIGYPIWWMDLPQVVKTFINDHDWSGKTVVPFDTSYSSGWSGTPDDIEQMTGATMKDGLALMDRDLPDGYDQVDSWYAGLGL
mgnify:FL=1